LRLNGWTLYRAVGAEHATVTGVRAQQRLAVFTFIEELADIHRHDFLLGKTTARTGQQVVRFERLHEFTLTEIFDAGSDSVVDIPPLPALPEFVQSELTGQSILRSFQ
jgi:hypothetical protein